jgi:cytochrome c553
MKNLFFITLLITSLNALADDVALGKVKADAACALCHGAAGIASLPNAPNLAGQQFMYLSEQLTNYRSGKRQNAVMNVIAKQLTDEEITQLATWYSAIKITVVEP